MTFSLEESAQNLAKIISESYMAIDLEKNEFRCSEISVHFYQVDKAVQLYETQKAWHTTMIVGPFWRWEVHYSENFS
jgi:hypothetical protein